MARLLETGSVSLSDTIDQGVVASPSFSTSYDNPVAVAYIPTRGGGQSIVYRCRNVTSSGMEVFMEEPDEQGHNGETLVWMVAEAGEYESASGIKFEAHTHSTSSVRASGDSGTFGDTISFNTNWSNTPTVLHTLNTYNNSDFMATQANSVSTSSFNLSQEAAQTGTSSSTETIGWIAFEQEPATATIDGNDIEINSENDGSNDGPDDTVHNVYVGGLVDRFDDGDISGWNVISGTWDGSNNYLENTSSNNNEEISRSYNNTGSGNNFAWEFDHKHDPSFYGAQTFVAYVDSNNYVYIRHGNSNDNYTRNFRIVENGTTQIDNDLGTYSNNWLNYVIEYDGAGNWEVYINGTLQGTSSYTPSFNFTDIRLRADNNGHKWDNFKISDGTLFSSAPDIIVSGQTMNSTDGYWARGAGTNWNTTLHDTYAEEDQVGDSERAHADETFGYVAISPNSTVDIALTPDAPSNLQASTASSTQIDLSWTDNSDNEDGFYIYRSTSSGTSKSDYTQIDSVGSNTTSYSDTGLSSGTTYYYRVSAFNSDGESSLSNEANTTTLSSVSGTVTLNSSGVSGATVYIIDDTNGDLEATATTDSNGNYSVDVPNGLTVHATVRYDDGSTKYTSKSKPFVTT